MIRFGIITAYPTEDASSQGLIEACARIGEAIVVDPGALAASVGAAATSIRCGGSPAEQFGVFLLVRGVGARGEPDLQFEIYRALEASGARVINRLDALLAAQDKFRTSTILARAGVATPEVLVAQQPADALAALETLGSAVVKPQWGSLGEGIELLHDDEVGSRRLLERLEVDGAVYLQRYVDAGGRDVRAFVVGARVEAAIERIAPPGEFRTNVSIGAEARAIDLPPEAEALAVRAVRALGLEWAGVDLAFGPSGPTVIEVNGSPNWEGIFRATGRDMAGAIARHAAGRARPALQVVHAPIEGMGG